jgi:hypothetical protein
MEAGLIGIGMQEGAYVGLFVLMGLPAEEGLALSFGARLLDIVFSLSVIGLCLPDAWRSIRRARSQGLPDEGGIPAARESP